MMMKIAVAICVCRSQQGGKRHLRGLAVSNANHLCLVFQFEHLPKYYWKFCEQNCKASQNSQMPAVLLDSACIIAPYLCFHLARLGKLQGKRLNNLKALNVN